MKKFIALLLVAVMSLSLVACGGGSENNNNESQTNESTSSEQQTSETPNDEQQTNESETQQETESVSSQETTENVVVATLDAEYLAGIWTLQEGAEYTDIRKIEICADGTGKVLSYIGEDGSESEATNTFEWNIANDAWCVDWLGIDGFGGYALVLSENDLMDLSGSYFFAKETE